MFEIDRVVKNGWMRIAPVIVACLLSLMLIPFEAQAAAGFGPQQYKSGYRYGDGIYFAPYQLNIYAEPNEGSELVESLQWRHGSSTTVASALRNTPLRSNNVFVCFYPALDVAMLSVVGDTDTGWAEVVYDQARKKTGWVKVQKEPANESETPAHFGIYQSWLDFMKLNAKANGIYWLSGVSQYNRSVRTADADEAKFLPLTIVRDLKVRHIRGNWLLVEVLDFERNTPIGWVRWRDNDGNLMVFPNFTGNKTPIVTTVY